MIYKYDKSNPQISKVKPNNCIQHVNGAEANGTITWKHMEH